MAEYGPLLEEVRRLRWVAGRPVRGGLPGVHPSTRRGTSAEFAEYRPYRQGDPLARVDWKLFARTDRAYLRLSPDRTVLPTMIVLDASASMDFPRGGDSKLERARQITVALAAVAHSGGDPVGVSIAAEKLTVFPPRTRGGTVGEITALVRSIRATGKPALTEALGAALRLAQRVVLVSDVLSDEQPLVSLLRAHRARGHEAYLVHIVARDELEPSPGAVYDPEEGSDVRVLDPGTRDGYDRAFGEWREQLATTVRAAGVPYVESVTGESVAADVRRVVAAGRNEQVR